LNEKKPSDGDIVLPARLEDRNAGHGSRAKG